MKPYYLDDFSVIYLGDCREILPTLPKVDLVLTDPPFSEYTHANAKSNRGVGHGNKAIDFQAIDFQAIRWLLAQIQCDGWFVSFMDWRHIAELSRDCPGLVFTQTPKRTNSHGAMPQISSDRPANGWDGICYLYPAGKPKKWNGGGHHGNWVGPTIVFLTWKPAATKLRHRLKFRLVPLELHTSETAFGLWPTPCANKITGTTREDFSISLPEAVRLWPTPRASANENRQTKPSPSQLAGKHGMNLASAVNLYPTPTAQDAKNSTLPVSQTHRDSIPGELLRQGETGQLNPAFVEWLMGYPIGHTALKDSGIRSSLRSPTKSSKQSTTSKPAKDPNREPF